jgi:hypothetical protein
VPKFLRGSRPDGEEVDWFSPGAAPDEVAPAQAGAAAGIRDVDGDRQRAATAPADLEQVGQHVAAVLAAAEAAAKKLRGEAERDAAATREEAARLAEEIRRQAVREADGERATSRRTLEEAELTATEIKGGADDYAATRRRDADERAAQIIREAEERAKALQTGADERDRTLRANIAASEQRLRELANSLRVVASSLDGLVGDNAAGVGNGPAEMIESLQWSDRPSQREQSTVAEGR